MRISFSANVEADRTALCTTSWLLILLSIWLVSCAAEQSLSASRAGSLPVPHLHPVNLDSVNWQIARSDAMRLLNDAGIPGTILLKIYVDVHGRYVSHTVVKSPHPIATRMIEEYLPALRFVVPEEVFHRCKGISVWGYRYHYTVRG